MDIQKLISEIHRNIKDSGIKYISKGGCGYVAFFVANELEKYNIPYKIRVVDKDLAFVDGVPIDEKARNIHDFVENKAEIDGELISFVHCWVEVEQDGETYKIDSGDYVGSYNIEDYQYVGFFTKYEMKVALRYADWNRTYQKFNNKKLRGLIRKAFQAVSTLKLLPTIQS